MVHTAATMSAAPAVPFGSQALFLAAGLLWLGFGVAAMRTRSLSLERRYYWVGYAGAGCLAAWAMLYQGWGVSLLALGIVAVYTVLHAYARTAYLKIGGRLFTASDVERRRDQAASGSTSPPPRREN